MNEAARAVIHKIAKLRALAQSDNVNEAANAAAAAEKLIQEHRLSEAELELTSDAPREEPEDFAESLDADTRIVTWKWNLAASLGSFYGVALYYAWETRPDPQGPWPYRKKLLSLRMVGRKSDVEIMRYQFAFLSVEIERLTQAFSKANRFARGQAKTAMNSYRLGAVSGVTQAMREARKRVTAAAPAASHSASMVLVDRGKEAEALKKRLHPDLTSKGSGGKSQRDWDAYGAGQSAGRGIHSSGALGVSSTTKALKK